MLSFRKFLQEADEHIRVQPKDKDDLIRIIEDTIQKEGNDCDLNFIDTSKITDMSRLFEGKLYYFNGDISKWNTSNVKNMDRMFHDSEFNGDISKWNTSKVVTMESMFDNSLFKGDISKWDVSNVKDMRYMFCVSKFNGDISKWNVSNVKRMYGAFKRSPLEGNEPDWYKL